MNTLSKNNMFLEQRRKIRKKKVHNSLFSTSSNFSRSTYLEAWLFDPSPARCLVSVFWYSRMSWRWMRLSRICFNTCWAEKTLWFRLCLNWLDILGRFSIILTLVLLNRDIPCFCKQCRSRSVGFWRSQLIWICIQKPIDLDLHCLSLSMWIYISSLDLVIWLAENWK